MFYWTLVLYFSNKGHFYNEEVWSVILNSDTKGLVCEWMKSSHSLKFFISPTRDMTKPWKVLFFVLSKQLCHCCCRVDIKAIVLTITIRTLEECVPSTRQFDKGSDGEYGDNYTVVVLSNCHVLVVNSVAVIFLEYVISLIDNLKSNN